MYILVEDSRIGLLLWALTNRYIYDDTFTLRFFNDNYPDKNIHLEDVNDWENRNYLKKIASTEKGRADSQEKEITGGADKLKYVLKVLSPGDKALIVLDKARSRGSVIRKQKQYIEIAKRKGIKCVILNYNCSADFLLGFKFLREWCISCSPKPNAGSINDANWTLLPKIQKALESNKLRYSESVDGWNDWTNTHKVGGTTQEDYIEGYLQDITKNSCLWYGKGSISDCWAYDCCYGEEFKDGYKRAGHGCIAEKWQYIYDHSTIKGKLEQAFKTLGIDTPERPHKQISVKAPYRIPAVRHHGEEARPNDVKVTDPPGWSSHGPQQLIVQKPLSRPQFYLVEWGKRRIVLYSTKINDSTELKVGDYAEVTTPISILHEYATEWQKFDFSGDRKSLLFKMPVYLYDVSLTAQREAEQSPTTPSPATQLPEQPPQSTAPSTAPPGQAEIPPTAQQCQHLSEAQSDAVARTLEVMLRNPSLICESDTNYIYSVIQAEKASTNSFKIQLFLVNKNDDITNFRNLPPLSIDTEVEIERTKERHTLNELIRYPNDWISISDETEGAFLVSKYKHPVKVVPTPPDQNTDTHEFD